VSGYEIMSNGPNFPPEDHNNPYADNPYANNPYTDNPNYSTPSALVS